MPLMKPRLSSRLRMVASAWPRNSTPCGRMIAALPVLLSDLSDVQQEGVVAVLLRRSAELEAAVVVLEAVAPRLDGERRIHDHEVERLAAGRRW